MMWKVAQCAVQGRSHIKNDVPCQDKTYFIINDDTVVSALADGAGSAKLSHYGAERITKFICEELSQNFDSYFNNDDGVLVKTELDTKIKNEINSLSAVTKQRAMFFSRSHIHVLKWIHLSCRKYGLFIEHTFYS